jgi:Fanconi anemia group M protein
MEAQKILNCEKPVIFADNREIKSNVTRHLKKYDAVVKEVQLEVGDYICSDRVACERKTTSDFISSIQNQRIFFQLQSLIDSYSSPLLILEGSPELLFLEPGLHPNSIRGALAKIAVDYRVPIIWTANAEESAAQIYWLAYREQVKKPGCLQIRSSKKADTVPEQQEFLVAGLPGINNVRAKKLLEHFKTPEKIFSASEEMLKELDGFGDKIARKIKDVLSKEYG